MKNTLFPLSLAASLLLGSCIKDPTNHVLDVVFPKPYKVLYADDVADSLKFVTFDSYQLSSLCDWLKVDGQAYGSWSYNPKNFYEITTKLRGSINASGRTRSGAIRIDSYEYVSAAAFYQLGCLQITNPAPQAVPPHGSILAYLQPGVPDSVRFELSSKADVEEATIEFDVKAGWTLSFAEGADTATWLTLDKTSGEKGISKVPIRMEPNASLNDARRTALVLTSSGVSNEIRITQLPRKDDED